MSSIVANIVDVYPFRRVAGEVEFLLLERSRESRLGGTWQAVHGKIEGGETAAAAALRELHEETGLRPIAFWQTDRPNVFFMAASDCVTIAPCFAAEIAAEARVALNAEHTAYRWMPAEAALREFMWPGQRAAIREILELIVNPSAARAHLEIRPEPE